MDFPNEIQNTCSIIKENRVTLLIRNDFKEKLLKQGILDPLGLISNPVNAGTTYKGRGLLPTLPINHSCGERMVAKQSLRGGLLRFLNRELFWQGNRPFKEMIVSTQLLSKGIKTTEILAAAKQHVFGPLYRNFIFSKEISGSIDLSGLFNRLTKKSAQERFRKKREVIKALARAIFTMHNQGIYHSDLHLKNILICHNDVSAEPDVYIIDFDKALLKERLSTKEKLDNLFRFNRSLEKYKFQGGQITRTDQVRLLKEYIRYDSHISDIINKKYSRYLRFLKVRRFMWTLLGFFVQTTPSP